MYPGSHDERALRTQLAQTPGATQMMAIYADVLEESGQQAVAESIRAAIEELRLIGNLRDRMHQFGVEHHINIPAEYPAGWVEVAGDQCVRGSPSRLLEALNGPHLVPRHGGTALWDELVEFQRDAGPADYTTLLCSRSDRHPHYRVVAVPANCGVLWYVIHEDQVPSLNRERFEVEGDDYLTFPDASRGACEREAAWQAALSEQGY